MNNLDRLARRPMLSWNQDGLSGLLLGVNVSITGLLFLVDLRVRNSVVALVTPLLWGLICLATRWALFRLKDKVVVPRRGYAVPRVRWETVVPAILVSLGLAAGCMWFLHTGHSIGSDLPTELSLAMALLVVVAAGFSWWRYRLVEFLCLAAMSLLVGVWTYFANAGLAGICLLLIADGCTLFAIGAVRLKLFLAEPIADQSNA